MDRTALASPPAWRCSSASTRSSTSRLRSRDASKRAGRAVVIEGAAGLGKSRLLELTHAQASELGFRVLSARGTELERGFPFGVVRQLFERALVSAEDDERERWLAGAAALGAEVLTGAPAGAAEPVGGAGRGRPQLRLAARAVLAGGEHLDRRAARARRRRPAVVRCAVGSDACLHRAPTRGTGAGADPGHPPARSGSDAGRGDARGRSRRDAAAPGAARRGVDRGDDRRASVRRASRALHPGVRSGDRWQSVPRRRAARPRRPLAVSIQPPGTPIGIGAIVPRGVSNAVLLRLARLEPAAGALARALSTLGDGAQVGDAARLAGLTQPEVEAGMAALVSAGVIEPGGTVRFVHPILRAAIYEDLSRSRARAAPLRRVEDPRGARSPRRAGRGARHADRALAPMPVAVTLLRDAAREALALGDATGAASLLGAGTRRAAARRPARGRGARARARPRARRSPRGRRAAGRGRRTGGRRGGHRGGGDRAQRDPVLRRPGSRRGRDPASRAGAAAGERAGSRAARGRAARRHLHLGVGAARGRCARSRRCAIRAPPRASVLEATTLAMLAMDELMYLRSASRAADLATRSLAAGLPSEPHRGEAWAIVSLAVLAATDQLDAALRGTDEILVRARERGAAATVANLSGLRAFHPLAARRSDRGRGGRAGGDRPGPRPARCRVRRPRGVVRGARRARSRRDARIAAATDRRRRHQLRRRVLPELAAALRIGRAAGRGTEPRRRDRGAARLWDGASGPGRREPGGAPVALRGGAVAGRARAPRRGTRARRR